MIDLCGIDVLIVYKQKKKGGGVMGTVWKVSLQQY